ncbi:hypothetical protein C923_04157 [Plasmodium falciparum UGT5.1]|uniref:Erythrocyte membrane protein 1 n=1 Tax=Plasmodium falciparum UGT5.1 TaxID=1237627 RepID=W7JJX7_PLAFA|nr:hypothetical protein C923_04157 [Plasmodium falciparum UGT5.1]
MAPGGSGGTQDAKHVLDSIGEKVYNEKVKSESNGFKDELKGNLQEATNRSGETVSSNKPCDLVKEYYTKRLGGNNNKHPCTNLSGKEERFSDTLGGQCTDSKIKGNKNNCGACAPYRRLHLCHHNLESIETTSTAKHDLLAEVCYAAKEEGESLKNYHAHYVATYGDLGSTICTVLARSFADIGDIIRGKDLYLGNPEEIKQRQQLDDKLKKIFGKIHSGLSNNVVIARYNGDDNNNYSKLRDDWWTANRSTVWEAITCGAGTSAQYFRQTCGGSGKTGTLTPSQCRCSDKSKPGKAGGDVSIVPTYFDYVPQYLRWFEEWAEDFCRLRKRKLEDAKNKCREQDKGGEKLYCDLNRYDCTQTASGKHVFVEEDNCIGCQYSCAHFVKWIDNQKLEFLKQKEKCRNEIPSSKRQKRSIRSGSDGNKYDGYEKNFYEQLKKSGYGTVNKFLQLLNNETTCTKKLKDVDEEEGTINFKTVKRSSASDDGNNKTFYRTTYCEACPWCGAEKVEGGWEAIKEDCSQTKTYDPENITDIPVLYPDKLQQNILKKYKKFCDTKGEKSAAGTATGKNGDQIETWKCYYYKENENNNDSSGAINFCVLQDENVNKKGQKVTSYNAFFWDWVHDMLHDSVEWRERLNSCINNAKSQNCKNNKCKTDCGCFEKWVGQKETEWEKIVHHFGKQKDIVQQTRCNPIVTLQYLFMNDDLLQNIKDTHADAKDIEHIKKMLEEAGVGGIDVAALAGAGSDMCTKGANGKHNTKIDKFLEEEERFAEKCKQKQNECEEQESLARSLDDPPSNPTADEDLDNEVDHSSDEDEDEEDDDEEEGGEEEEGTEQEPKEAEAQPEASPSQDKVNPCEIVKTLFSSIDKFSDACTLKYGPKAPTSWKCIPSGKPGDNTGSICIPPRRRRLYVTPLTKWAKTVVEPQGGGEPRGPTEAGSQETSGQKTPVSGQAQTPQGDAASPSHSRDVDLRNAFVESAAVETFFLWDRYKKEWELKKAEEQQRQQENGELATLNSGTLGDSGDQTPEQQLSRGDIPTDFLRQMFYTLGDYRDICTGDENVIKLLKDGGDNNIETINKKIKEILEKVDSKQPGPLVTQNSENPRESWWDNNAKHIWNGMIYALTYEEKSSGSGDKGQSAKIEQNGDLKDKLWDDDTKKPKQNGTHNYTYEGVRLEDENSGPNAPASTTSQTTLNNPKLTQFVLRPTYFRYLEEWGETFCRKRTDMLGKIKHECRNSDRGGHHYCSGDGYDCTRDVIERNNNFASLDCINCLKECMKYKKWIKNKEKEFNNQKSKYEEERVKVITSSNNGDDDNKNFCKQIQKHSTAADFLAALKHCKDNQGNSNQDDEDKLNKINFENIPQTFSPSTYCKACPIYGVKCNRTCNAIDESLYKETKSSEKKENDKDPTDIEVLVLGRKGEEKDKDKHLDDACKNTGLFEVARYEQWNCQKKKGIDQCKITKFANDIDFDKDIVFNEFFQRWLRYFIYDYNKLKHKIHPCTKKETEKEKEKSYKCTQGCNDKCECVKEWLSKKKQEWTQIKTLYKQYSKISDQEIAFRVKSYFREQLHFDNQATKAQEVVETPCKKQELWGCTGDNLKHGEKPENCDKGDFITNLISELEKKIKTCPGKRSGDQTKQTCENSTPLEDDEEPLEETENPVDPLNICPQQETTEETVDESDCKPAATPSGETDQHPEQTPVIKPEEEAAGGPVGPPAAPPKPTPPYLSPPLKTALVTSTLAWSVGIGFAAFTYFFLKKKTKSSVGNLFQILQIPKSDHDIPTKLSPNRYIPYTSGKYRGKRYIYLEGDSGTDSGYTDHYSDITSSSESEYEDLDINDIYAPRAPKYKTLIEVVLEPSGNNTTASGNNTTASGKNTPSDTQNDIQNDGIPSSKITDNEWNTLKDEFISNMLQNKQNTEPNMLGYNVDNNTNPKTLHVSMDEKPFIMFIQDRNLLNGEEYNYDMFNSGKNGPYSDKNDLYSGNHDSLSGNRDPTSDNHVLYSGNHHPYSGIDLINDTLSGNKHIDIYDELLKRKENELFGTEHHPKRTTTNHFAKPARDDPIHNQLELFHKWLDRHRDMCEKLKNDNERLAKLKEEWENETHSGNTHPSDSNKTLNTDVKEKYPIADVWDI